LLARGFHIVTGPVPYNADGPLLEQWNAVYHYFVQHGFSPKPVMEGAAAGAGEVYAWAIANPGKVSCIYAENPILRSRMSAAPLMEHLDSLAEAGVPLFHVCGSLDPWLNENTGAVEKRYRQLGGKINVVIEEGVGHMGLRLSDPQAVDFIVKRVK
jgi:pimeloyl-ACP methyl ester carboxylesterase